MLPSQPGILAQPLPYGRSLTFRLAPDADHKAALDRLRDGWDPAGGVIGIGAPLARALGASVPGLDAFPALAGIGCSVPSTQQALWALPRAADRSAVFDRAQRIAALLAPALVLDDALDTWNYQGSRDLTGYEDGTENPKGEDAIDAAISAVPPLAGSSFVAVQRWVHDLAGFNARPKAERDAIIGRERETNEELEDAPESAHVKRTAQEDYDPPAFMLRRSMPWSTGLAQGLEFIAFGHSTDAFARQMRRMAGLEDGVVDALFRFSRPVTGGYYWCPPLADKKLDLRLIGL